MTIWITSDWHFNHDRAFVYEPRGFKSVEEMNEVIIEKHNEVVTPEDDVYVLGDLCLGDNELGRQCISQLNGKLHVVLGNHDTNTRVKMYQEMNNIVSVNYAEMVKFGKYRFYLSHYPTLTANLEKESLKQCVINLFGHTHQTTNFYNDIPFMYHVGADSHDCYPVNLEEAIQEMKDKVKECKYYL